VDISVDGEGSWSPFASAATFGNSAITSGAVDPLNRVVYVIAGGRLFLTSNGGQTWSERTPPESPISGASISLIVDPVSATTLYATAYCGSRSCGGLQKSSDGGQTWSTLAIGIHDLGVVSMTGTTANLATLYVSTNAESGSNVVTRLFESPDGGQTWRPRSDALPSVNELVVDPTNGQVLYTLTGSGLFRSGDGGLSFLRVDASIPCNTIAFQSMAVSAATPTTLYYTVDGYPCEGLFKSTDSGGQWVQTSSAHGFVLADPTDASVVYLSGFANILKSTDGGVTFAPLPSPVGQRLAIDPSSPTTLYAGGSAVFKSVDGGTNWTPVGDPGVSLTIAAMVVDPQTSDLYILDSVQGVLMLGNGATSWTNLGLASGSANSLLTVGGGQSILYAGTRVGGVWSIRPTLPASAKVTSFTASATFPVVGGSAPPITWTATATGGTPSLSYEFRRWDPIVQWQVVRGFGALNTYTWTPAAADSGAHVLQVRVRSQGAALDDDVRSVTFTVSGPNPAGPPANLVAGSAPADLRRLFFDYNADGAKDLLIYNQVTGAWAIQIGNAQGRFTDGPSGGWAPAWDVHVADFNGDRFDDLFLNSPQTGVWYKVINTGAGFSYFSQGWQTGFRVFIVDLNGDCIADVVMSNPMSGVWFTCISVGDGTTGFACQTGGWATGWKILPAEFNGDTKADFFLYNPVNGVFYKAIGDGSGGFRYSSGGWAPNWLPVIAELNGDGRDDVFLYNSSSGIWYRATSVGDGTVGFDYEMGGWASGWSVQPADFDGNGETDLFLYNANGVWYKVINTGTGFTYFNGGWRLWETTIEDLNGDGKSDVFLYNPGTGVWYQALTTTPGAFAYTTGGFP
jgi:hypothetical protein